MTVFWFMHHPGHGGGGWLLCICNNHPTPMSCLGEVGRPSQLSFAARGLGLNDRDDEVRKFYEDRLYYGDRAIGIVKSFNSADVKFALQHGKVRVVQLIYNPRSRWVQKGNVKRKVGARWYEQTYKGKMVTEQEQMLAVATYFTEHFWAKALRLASNCPIIRLEDLNLSLKLGTGFFARFMEYLTGVEWPPDYVDRIREYYTPAFKYYHYVKWENPPYGGRIRGVFSRHREKMALANRDNWDPDPLLVKYWNAQPEWKRRIWIEVAGETENRLGYNDDMEICLKDDWIYRGAYPWGEVYE